MAALGAGASMVGATIMGAVAAADLNDWPSPFLTKEKKLDAFFVFGDNAAASDVAGAVDLATALQASAVVEKKLDLPSSGGVSASGGDSHMIGESSDFLEINEQLAAVDVTLTDSDLPTLLKGGTLSNSRGSTKYNQYLRFLGPTSNTTGGGAAADRNGTVIFRENEYDQVADFLYYKDGDGIFEWEIEFTEGLESDVDTNLDLEDIEDMDIPILGVPFSVVTSDRTRYAVELELMGGSIAGKLGHGETASYELKGKTYTITPQIFSSSSQVVFSGDVDGVSFTTKTLKDGETVKLSDGTTLGVSDLLTSSKETVADTVKFFLGAGKVKFKDTNHTSISTTTGTSTVEINEESIEDAIVNIQGTNSSGRLTISSIRYRLLADAKKGDTYIPAGGKVRDQQDEPEGFLHEKWDITYKGLTDPGKSVIDIKPSGDDAYKLAFENRDGAAYNIDFLDNTTALKYGDDDDDLEFIEAANVTSNRSFTIERNDYFVLTDQNNEKGLTRIYRYDSIDASSKIVTFSDLAGGSLERSYTGTPKVPATAGAIGDIIVSGKSFKFWVGGAPNYNLSVDLNADGDVANDEANVVVKGGGILDLGVYRTLNGSKVVNIRSATNATTGNLVTVSLTTRSSEFDESPTNNEVARFHIRGTALVGNKEMDADLVNVTRSSGATQTTGAGLLRAPFKIREREGTGDIKKSMTDYGVYIEEVDESSEPGKITIHYPLKQRYGQVFVTGEGVSFNAGSSSSVMTQEVQKIQVGAAKLASEIKDSAAQNLIVVGGPCANVIASKLMGSPANCAAGFEEGKAIVKLYDTGAGNVALLVAGYSAMDTRRASKAVAQGKLSGLANGVSEATVTTVTDTPVVTVVA